MRSHRAIESIARPTGARLYQSVPLAKGCCIGVTLALIALARGRFELLAIEDRHLSTMVADQPGLLEGAGGDRHARPAAPRACGRRTHGSG